MLQNLNVWHFIFQLCVPFVSFHVRGNGLWKYLFDVLKCASLVTVWWSWVVDRIIFLLPLMLNILFKHSQLLCPKRSSTVSVLHSLHILVHKDTHPHLPTLHVAKTSTIFITTHTINKSQLSPSHPWHWNTSWHWNTVWTILWTAHRD